MPFVWDAIEFANSIIFRLLYGRKFNAIYEVLAEANDHDVVYSLATIKDVNALVDFFRKQPVEAFVYFKPHEFDKKTILGLIRDPAFIIIIAYKDSVLVGYSFLRCFANGKSFRGKIVDIDYRGLGIAKKIGFITTEIASKLGINLYGTIAKTNVSSMASSKSSNDIKVIEELPNDYLLIQYLPKK